MLYIALTSTLTADMDPEVFEQSLQHIKSSTALQQLITALQKQGISTTKGSLVSDADQLVPTVTPALLENITSEFRREVRQVAREHKWPTRSIRDVHVEHECYRKQQQRRKRLCMNIFYRTDDPRYELRAEHEFDSEMMECVIKEGLVSWGVNCVSGRVYDRPLMYVHAPSLDDHPGCLIMSPVSKNLDVKMSLINLLRSTEMTGHTESQVVLLIKELLEKHLPTLFPIAANKTDFYDVLEIALCGLNVQDDVDKIESCISNFVRTKSMSIMETSKTLECLQLELYAVQCPKQDYQKRVKRAQQAVIRVLSSFLGEEVKNKFEKYKAMKKRNNEDLDLDQCIAYLSHLESDKENRIKADKHFDQDLVNVMVYGNVFKRKNKHSEGRRNSIGNHGRRSGRSRSSSGARKSVNTWDRDDQEYQYSGGYDHRPYRPVMENDSGKEDMEYPGSAGNPGYRGRSGETH